MIRRWLIAGASALLVHAGAARAQLATTQPAEAAALYRDAAAAIVTDSPAASNLFYPDYPPLGDAWMRLAEAAWDENRDARRLAREARAFTRADWPQGEDFSYLNSCRALANDLGDAALFLHFQRAHAEAVDLVKDVMHMAKLLQQSNKGNAVQALVSVGIDALAMQRLMIITSAVSLTNEPTNRRDLQVDEVRRLIEQLLDYQAPDQILKNLDREPLKIQPGGANVEFNDNRAIETIQRVNAERNFAAMSLACHLFRNDKERWPNDLNELVPDYLPRVMVDPWGDGTQTLGYVLIKAGLPDGGDRPLVYSRCDSRDGLFYRVDQPAYGFYVGDGSDLPIHQQKRGGQFRDVTRWTPPAVRVAPTTRPLP